MYKFGFTTVTFRTLDPLTILDIAKESGVNVIEWGGDVHIPPTDIKNANNIGEVSKKYNIHACTYGSYYRIVAKNNDAKNFLCVCLAAKALGASVIRLWLSDKPSQATDSTEVAELVKETQIIADIAKEHKITIAFEFHNGTYNDNGKTSADFINKCARDNIKTLWQPLGDMDLDLANLKEVLPHLIEVHVFNWNKLGRRYLLKRGIDKWEKFVKIIKDNNSDCNYILEFVKKDKVKIFKKDIIVLKDILRRIYGE